MLRLITRSAQRAVELLIISISYFLPATLAFAAFFFLSLMLSFAISLIAMPPFRFTLSFSMMPLLMLRLMLLLMLVSLMPDAAFSRRFRRFHC